MNLAEKLLHARGRAALTLQQVADRTAISPPSLSAYEHGHREPSFAQLAKLARLYRRPVQFFLTDAPVEVEAVVWRVKPPSPVAEELEAKLLEFAGQFHALEGWTESVRPCTLPKYDLTAAALGEDTVARLASQVRGALRLGDRPAANLLPALEEAGVKVFHLPFEPLAASASTVSETFGPAVLLNARADRRTRAHALAHELFHLLTWAIFPADSAEGEHLADCFADHLLLPDEPVRLAVDSLLKDGKATFGELDAVARAFDIPLEPFLWRLGALFGRMQEDTRADVQRLQAAGGLPEAGPAEAAPPSRPERFVRLAARAYEQGKLALGRLAHYLGISRQEASRRFREEQEMFAQEEVQVTPR